MSRYSRRFLPPYAKIIRLRTPCARRTARDISGASRRSPPEVRARGTSSAVSLTSLTCSYALKWLPNLNLFSRQTAIAKIDVNVKLPHEFWFEGLRLARELPSGEALVRRPSSTGNPSRMRYAHSRSESCSNFPSTSFRKSQLRRAGRRVADPR